LHGASADEVQVRYEALRRSVLDKESEATWDHGLIILMRQGMAAWILAEASRMQENNDDPGKAHPEARTTAVAAAGLSAELARLVAGMVLHIGLSEVGVHS
jgi:hypothetical protein